MSQTFWGSCWRELLSGVVKQKKKDKKKKWKQSSDVFQSESHQELGQIVDYALQKHHEVLGNKEKKKAKNSKTKKTKTK